MRFRSAATSLVRTIATGQLVAVLIGASAPVALAHPGGPEQVIVAGDHVDQGTAFRVFASAIEPDVDVLAHVVAGSRRFDLGTIHVAADGSFDVTLTLPADVPNGYAQFVLIQPTSGEAGTTFLVGPRAEGAAAGAASSASDSFVDSQLGATLLFVATLGGIAGVIALLLRGRSSPSA